MNKNIYKIYMLSKKYNKSRRYSKKSKLSKIKRRKYKTIRKNKINKKYNKRGGAVAPEQAVPEKEVPEQAVPEQATEQAPEKAAATLPEQAAATLPEQAPAPGLKMNSGSSKKAKKTAAQERNNLLIGGPGTKGIQKVTQNPLKIKEEIVALNKKKFVTYNNIKTLPGLVKLNDIVLDDNEEKKLGSGGFGGVYRIILNSNGKKKNYALKLFTPNNTSINSVKRTAELTGKKEMTCIEYINNLREIIENNTNEKDISLYSVILKNEKSRLSILNREIKALIGLGMFPTNDDERQRCITEKNIVILEGLSFTKSNILQGYLMEICDGSLEGCTLNNKCQLVKPNKKDVLFSFKGFLKQVLRGLNWIHNKNLAHLDLFPRNILHKKYLNDGGANRLKICDFGFTEKIDDKVRSLFPPGEFITIPNNHHIDFYQETAIIKKDYDYYTLGISIIENFINKQEKIKPTITNTQKLINYNNSYTQLIRLPTVKELERYKITFDKRKENIIMDLDTDMDNYVTKKFNQYIPDNDLTDPPKFVERYIPEILKQIIEGREVKYNDTRFNFI